MKRIIDLSMPVRENHFRWNVERRLHRSHDRGDQMQSTWAGWNMHSFSHMDTPRHFDCNGFTTDEVTPDMTIGDAALVDISEVPANSAIDVDVISRAGSHVHEQDIVLLKAGWDLRESVDTPEFWTTAPYMTANACVWLREKHIKAIGFDFPQDYCIRHYVLGDREPEWAENTTHVELLCKGILMFEYLCNLSEIRTPRPYFIGLPLKLANSDGVPLRAVAIENWNE